MNSSRAVSKPACWHRHLDGRLIACHVHAMADLQLKHVPDTRIIGYNYRMHELSAALGMSQLKRIDAFLMRRERVAARYSAFSGARLARYPRGPAARAHELVRVRCAPCGGCGPRPGRARHGGTGVPPDRAERVKSEVRYMKACCGESLLCDPYYNPTRHSTTSTSLSPSLRADKSRG